MAVTRPNGQPIWLSSWHEMDNDVFRLVDKYQKVINITFFCLTDILSNWILLLWLLLRLLLLFYRSIFFIDFLATFIEFSVLYLARVIINRIWLCDYISYFIFIFCNPLVDFCTFEDNVSENPIFYYYCRDRLALCLVLSDCSIVKSATYELFKNYLDYTGSRSFFGYDSAKYMCVTVLYNIYFETVYGFRSTEGHYVVSKLT